MKNSSPRASSSGFQKQRAAVHLQCLTLGPSMSYKQEMQLTTGHFSGYNEASFKAFRFFWSKGIQSESWDMLLTLSMQKHLSSFLLCRWSQAHDWETHRWTCTNLSACSQTFSRLHRLRTRAVIVFGRKNFSSDQNIYAFCCTMLCSKLKLHYETDQVLQR